MDRSVLIVYAHQSSRSFNAAARDVAVEVLQNLGCQVTVSDLYAMGFKACATRQDITGDLHDPENFHYGEEAGRAWKEGRLSDDIKAEQQKLVEAQLIIFQFPMYWFSVPAILKGWIDRVLIQGFAFSMQKIYGNGVFKDKKAILSFTTGSMESMFQPDGLHGDINVALWPLQNGVLYFCGFQVLPPQIFWAPAYNPPERRDAMLQAWRERLATLWEESPLHFAPTHLFDLSFSGGFRLRPEVKEQCQAEPYGISIGQHLGKSLPPNSQTKAPPSDDLTKAGLAGC